MLEKDYTCKNGRESTPVGEVQLYFLHATVGISNVDNCIHIINKSDLKSVSGYQRGVRIRHECFVVKDASAQLIPTLSSSE